MIRFRVEVDGFVALDRAFNRLDKIDDFRPIWPYVIETFYQIESRQFESEGASGESGRWAPLSPAYAEYKKVAFPGAPILQATTDLRDSLTNPEAAGAIIRPETDQLTLGSSVPYALSHQRGTGRMPARPPISLSEDNKREMQKAIQRGLVQFTRQAGFDVEEAAA